MDSMTGTLLNLFLLSTMPLLSSPTTDTLFSGQSLTSNQTLISKGGMFELGFFKPGDSLNYYVGIWYKKVSIQNTTYVWVANRDAPITDPSSAELKLLKDGNLVLFDHSKMAVWSTSSNIKAMNSSEAVLGDDGNLMLRYGLQPSDVYWQSFDHPGDTWLPGGKFGYDSRSKRSLSLTSRRSPSDPSMGLFSINLEPTQVEWIMEWNQTQIYRRSGRWNGEMFPGFPEMMLNKGVFETRYVKTTNMSYYFTISLVNPSIFARCVMDFTGQIKMFIWDDITQQWFQIWSIPSRQCEVYSFCGAFAVCNPSGMPLCACMEGFQPRSPEEWNMSNFHGGCVRKPYVQCWDTFSLFPNVTLPVNRRSVEVTSADDCKLACLNNCSCSAYAYRSSRCSIVYGDLSIVPESYGGSDLYIRLPTSAKQSSGGKHKNAITGGIVGGTGALIVSVLIYTWLKTRAKCKGCSTNRRRNRHKKVLKRFQPRAPGVLE